MSAPFKTDAEKIFQALSMWANQLETGDSNMSLNDAKNCGMQVRPMNVDQAVMANDLRELACRELAKKNLQK